MKKRLVALMTAVCLAMTPVSALADIDEAKALFGVGNKDNTEVQTEAQTEGKKDNTEVQTEAQTEGNKDNTEVQTEAQTEGNKDYSYLEDMTVRELRELDAAIHALLGDSENDGKASEGYGSVKGNVTYYFNDYKGNVADTGSTVIVFPEDYTVEKEFILWTSASLVNSELNEFGIYAAEVDGMGSYTISNVPAGKYRMLIISNETKEEKWFNDQDNYHKMVSAQVEGYIGEQNLEKFLLFLGPHKYEMTDIVVYDGKETVYSYDFGTTYI